MKRRPVLAAALALAVILVAALLIAWFARFRVATAIVDRKLAAAHVPASYQITRIGPFLERMENVRLGDPAAPDLLARRIDVAIGYGFSGPMVRRITVDGVRLRGRYDEHGLSLGTLDRLLPKSGGRPTLPDIMLSIRDAELALATPAGTVTASIAGEGNPARSFRGKAGLVALALSAGGCVVRDVAAKLRIGSEDGAPNANGPVRISGLACPAQRVALGPGAARVALSSDATFERMTLDANLAGLGGQIQGTRFASLHGTLSGSRSSNGYGADVRLALNSASAPGVAERLRGYADAATGTPLHAPVRRAMLALSALLDRADTVTDFRIAGGGTGAPEVVVRNLALTGADGGRLKIAERGGLRWTEAGFRADADIAVSGGDLPTLTVQLRQAAAGAPFAGLATLQPYRVGDAQLSATPVRFGWDGRRATFDTVLAIDGPIGGSGFVRGLSVPVRGHATAADELVIGAGCQTLAMRQLTLASFTFRAATLPICGGPIVAQTAGGALRIDATSGPVLLTGRTSTGAPVTLGAARIRLTAQGFAARRVTALLGGPAQPTRLTIGSLDGAFRADGLRGRFADAAGAIGNVPLLIADANGSWRMAGSDLHLTGTLGVRDAAAAARFNPLVTDNAVLALRGGAITARATLRAPASRAAIARVDLVHDLNSGTGHALLDVPGIVFVPKGLQPEQLTPLTLGVVANVAGTVSGNGRIDWNARGVTSSGTFGTDGLNLAAAFGPVTGIKGQLHFTDLLGLVSAPHQEATIAEINPGVAVTDGVLHYQLIGQNRVAVEDARWPFAGGTLRLEPTTLDFSAAAERHLTFRIEGLDAAAFIQQLDFPNISATGTFDGALPMIFDQQGGRIEGGSIVARGPGTLAYVGELSNAQLGTMGKLAFDALKAIRYSSLDISLDGRLDGEMVSRVRFLGVREATPEQSFVTRLIRNLPFRFNIAIRAPFRGLVGSARAYINPSLLLNQVQRPVPPPKSIQPSESGPVR